MPTDVTRLTFRTSMLTATLWEMPSIEITKCLLFLDSSKIPLSPINGPQYDFDLITQNRVWIWDWGATGVKHEFYSIDLVFRNYCRLAVETHKPDNAGGLKRHMRLTRVGINEKVGREQWLMNDLLPITPLPKLCQPSFRTLVLCTKRTNVVSFILQPNANLFD